MERELKRIVISIILASIFSLSAIGQTRVGKFGVGVEASGQYMMGAGGTNPSPAIGGGFNLSYSPIEYFGIRSKFSYSNITWKGSGMNKSQTTSLMSLNLYVGSDLMPNNNINIFPFIGAGLAIFDPRDDNFARANDSHGNPVNNTDIHILVGGAVDYFLNEFWSVSLMGEYVFTNSAYYAGSTGGNANLNKNDSFVRGSIQIRYYFFDQSFIAKMLDALKDRYKKK